MPKRSETLKKPKVLLLWAENSCLVRKNAKNWKGQLTELKSKLEEVNVKIDEVQLKIRSRKFVFSGDVYVGQ